MYRFNCISVFQIILNNNELSDCNTIRYIIPEGKTMCQPTTAKKDENSENGIPSMPLLGKFKSSKCGATKYTGSSEKTLPTLLSRLSYKNRIKESASSMVRSRDLASSSLQRNPVLGSL